MDEFANHVVFFSPIESTVKMSMLVELLLLFPDDTSYGFTVWLNASSVLFPEKTKHLKCAPQKEC